MTRVEAQHRPCRYQPLGAHADAAPCRARGAAQGRDRREIAELRARDALKTQFLANISHDLRTPLTAVITHAEILRDGILGDLSPRQIESIRGIISGGRQLLESGRRDPHVCARRGESAHARADDVRDRATCSSR